MKMETEEYSEEFSFLNSPTILLVMINILIYIYTSIIGGDFIQTSDDVLVKLGQYNKLVLNGAYWQLFTAMFIHVNITHLIGNMIFLLIFGLKAEELFSNTQYLMIYFGSGLFGNVLTLLLPPRTLSAGASGAIFGVLGACIIFMFQSIIAVIFYSLLFFMMSASPRVNLYAHFGGLVAGLALGYLFLTLKRRQIKRRYEYRISYRI